MNYRYQPAAPRLKHVGLGGALAGMLLLAGGHNAAAVATPAPTASPDAGATALGLPALSTAQHYNLAPASRRIVPRSISTNTSVNDDFVTATSLVSETSAHQLQAGPASSTTVRDGTTVRQAGPGVPGAQFSYQMHAPAHHAVTVRVEESGSATSEYEVFVGARQVHHRSKTDTQYVLGANPVGVVHYEISIPPQLVTST